MPGYKAAIFDMDGTILNTIDDLTFTINHIMGKTGHRHDFTSEDTCEFVSSGALTAVRRALALEAGADRGMLELMGTPNEILPEHILTAVSREENRLLKAFMEYYPKHCGTYTVPYAGIPEALHELRSAGVLTAVVSNKPDRAVQLLCKKMFPGLFDMSIGEQEGIRRKPFPDMTELALQKLKVPKEQAVYLGDSEVDIQTAAASGLDCISVSWGFRSKTFLQKHGAVIIATCPNELPDLIIGYQRNGTLLLSRGCQGDGFLDNI